jgi:hypothetical protein
MGTFVHRLRNFLLFWLLITILFLTDLIGQKIPLNPTMVHSETVGVDFFHNAEMLVDEQIIAGDPAAGKGGNPVTSWHPGWGYPFLYPASVLIDLKGTYNITKIYFYDIQDKTTITIYSGTPSSWKELLVEPLGYGWDTPKWNGHDVSVTSRYLKLTRSDGNSNLPEIVIYGTLVGSTIAEPVAKAQLQPTMDKFIGINAFGDDPIDKIQVAGVVREYHNWFWAEGDVPGGKWGTINTAYPGYPNNQNKFSPGTNGIDYDNFYTKLHNAGIIAFPSILRSVPWLTLQEYDKPFPVGSNRNPEDPASYIEHADHMYQFVARYGSTKVADTDLKLAAGQPRKSGLNLLNYFEDWNEQNAWWVGRSGCFFPYEYAAMASADYDGHQGKMGKKVGVKNADPNAKMVMGGLAELSLDYIKAMKFWADQNRGGSFPADVINVHHYSSDAGGQSDNAKTGVSPEADKLKEKMKAFSEYRNKYLPGKEIWLSEFGYDTNPYSIYHAPVIGTNSEYEVQGQWLVRSYLEMAAAGVDRATMFMLRDNDFNQWSKFNTSGLVSSKGTGWMPKISWYYVYTLKNTLTGMRFNKEEISGDPKVNVYSFKSENGIDGAFVVWCNTSEGKVIKDYKLKLGKGASSATLITMKDKDTDGVPTLLNVSNGTVTIEVSERPVYVKVNDVITSSAKAEEELKNGLQVFPTVTEDEVNILIGDHMNSNDLKISLYDSGGILKLRSTVNASGKKETMLSMNKFAQGIYLLTIEDNKGIYTEKIVKY